MKNTDIAAIILIASLSMLAAYFVADNLIGKPSSESVKVKTVEKISADVQEPDTTVFNKDAINPTVPVTIGEANASTQSSTGSTGTGASNTETSQQNKR